MLVAKREENHYYKGRNKKKEKKKGNNKNKSNEKLKFLMGATIILLACLFVLLRYTYITQMRLENSKLESQKVELKKEKQDLMAELDRVKSDSKIEKDAKIKLGMYYPSEEQIVYVSIDDKANDEDKLVGESKQKEDFFIVGYFKNMMNMILK
ncbi:MAG: cell division protein FtsL [Clostridiaceae bacterium]|nr:cell division protein FtsL [Clostridiaceae bacterium]MBW4859775.1 cell division protein FtsL [Clostridiaceae bacterium]MBW4869795.1 cell division protein FtsL [Clostridiaceae bacterium]